MKMQNFETNLLKLGDKEGYGYCRALIRLVHAYSCCMKVGWSCLRSMIGIRSGARGLWGFEKLPIRLRAR